MSVKEKLRALANDVRQYKIKSAEAARGTVVYRDALAEHAGPVFALGEAGEEYGEKIFRLITAATGAIKTYETQAAEAEKLADQLEAMADTLEAGSCPICGQEVSGTSKPEGMTRIH
jgi:hypothetical protein